jgi:hypothetical protein
MAALAAARTLTKDNIDPLHNLRKHRRQKVYIDV